jgi:hypothetical protein
MRKLFVVLTTALLMTAMVSCEFFKKNDSEKGIIVENVLEKDINYMYSNYDTNYVWFETQIVLDDYLDEECDGSIERVTNIFQVIMTNDSVTFDTKVFKITHIDDLSDVEVIDGFWIEDMAMNYEDIAITYKQAFQLINEVNFTKPHSKNCVLRQEVGPKVANPQYIFGNIESQLYVDAVNGEVTENSPSFSEEEILEEEVAEDTIQ